MTTKRKCGNADGTCYGEVKTVIDPYAYEINDETVKITVCEKHLQDRLDDI